MMLCDKCLVWYHCKCLKEFSCDSCKEKTDDDECKYYKSELEEEKRRYGNLKSSLNIKIKTLEEEATKWKKEAEETKTKQHERRTAKR